MNKLDINEKLDLILLNQSRLYWLITQAPGVANYASDVERFSRIEATVGTVTYGELRSLSQLVSGYTHPEAVTPEDLSDLDAIRCKYLNRRIINESS